MSNLSSTSAAELASGVYDISQPELFGAFIRKRKEFSQNKNDRSKAYGEVGSRLINVSDAFGVCVKGDGVYKNELFLIFRGSTKRNFGADWVSNARAGLNTSQSGSLVHTGFNHIFTSMIAQLSRFLDESRSAHTVHCIGHSLGGAVANIAADWIADRYNFAVKLYTFGAPRVGLGHGGFASKLTTKLLPENIYRVFHSTDPVPMAPLYPFMHAPVSGQAYYIPFSGLTINISAHSMENYIQSVSGHAWGALYQPAPSFSPAAIKQWLEGNSENNPHSISFWNKLHYAIMHIVQKVLSIAGVAFSSAMTIADHIAMILQKGVNLSGEIASWVFLFARKIMRALSMRVVETIEELTIQMLRLLLNKLTRRIAEQAARALDSLL